MVTWQPDNPPPGQAGATPPPPNGNGSVIVDAETRTALAELKSLEASIILARTAFARQVGITFEGKRDTYDILGYFDLITTADYRARYQRGGLTGRIVDVFPNATWRGTMEIIEDETIEEYTEFEKAWAELDKRLQIQAKLLRTDKLAGLSTYSVLLLGAEGDPDLSNPLPKARRGPASLLYLAPFAGGGGPGGGSAGDRAVAAGADATIYEYEQDPANERFGLPKLYTLKRTDLPASLPRPVHWTRIIHIAEGLLDDEVYGLPTLERVWNLLDDLDKVTGGGAEAFWLRANQGMHIDVDKDMALPDAKNAVAELKVQMEAYKHQLDRWIRTRGVKVDVLGSDVANFSGPADVILTQIAGAKGIPKRILTGSEMGELASSQDRDNWKDQIIGRQTQYAAPYIVRPLIARLIEYGYLPTPKKGVDAYEVKWPHIQTLTEQEKASGAATWAGTVVDGEPVFTDSEIRAKWYDMAPLTPEQRAEIQKLREEALKLQQPIAPTATVPTDPSVKASFRGAQTDLSSTQIQVPAALAREILAYGRGLPAFALRNGNPDDLETDIHITVKYGLHTVDPEAVQAVLSGMAGPIPFRLGKTAYFSSADDYDVLYIEVDSPQLVDLNALLSAKLENTQTQLTYVPHVTVAYLKKGLGPTYSGDGLFDGAGAAVGSVTFSPAGELPDTTLPLSITAAEEAELVYVLSEALREKNFQFVERFLGGSGSGNFGHAGRPGEIGGSGGGGGVEAESAKQNRRVADALYLEVIRSQRFSQDDIDRVTTQKDGSAEFAVRHFGSWQVPAGEEDDGDYDFKEPTPATRAKLNDIVTKAQTKNPDVHITWSSGEKNWVYFTVDKK